MFAALYFISCSILLLVAETLLRSVGLTFPLLGFFFVAASFAVSSRMALCFAMLAGIALDFVMGYTSTWSGLLLPLLTLPALFLHGKRPLSDVLEFLIGAAIPLVMAVPNVRFTFTSPEAFASLLTSSNSCDRLWKYHTISSTISAAMAPKTAQRINAPTRQGPTSSFSSRAVMKMNR